MDLNNVADREENQQVVSVSLALPDNHHAMPSKLTKVIIDYPDNHKGAKHYKNGHVATVAPETAEQFIKAGIAVLADGEETPKEPKAAKTPKEPKAKKDNEVK